MDRAELQHRVTAVEQRLAKGERRLERQRATVASRRHNGWNSREAEALLVEFELAQTIDRVDLDHLRAQLTTIPL